MKRLWSWMALNQAQRVDRAMWPPTTAGWARSTTKIPPGLNGANCRRIPALRGLASLAAAATAIIEFIFWSTSTPHDYKGASYDGTPADVSTVTFAYELHGHRWETINANTYDPRADGRGLLETPLGPVVLGAMVKI